MIEEDLYRETLLELFKNPPNRGELKDPDLQARLVNPICGDEIILQIKLENKVVEKALFSGNGCAISQASASLLASFIEGKTLFQLKMINSNDILNLLGVKPNPARLGCALLCLEVLKESLKNAS